MTPEQKIELRTKFRLTTEQAQSQLFLDQYYLPDLEDWIEKSFPVEKPSSVAEPNPTFGQWIDVKVLLPNVDERVLLYVDDLHNGEEENNSNKILFGYLRKSGKIKPDGCLGDYNVTKWMPLPKL